MGSIADRLLGKGRRTKLGEAIERLRTAELVHGKRYVSAADLDLLISEFERNDKLAASKFAEMEGKGTMLVASAAVPPGIVVCSGSDRLVRFVGPLPEMPPALEKSDVRLIMNLNPGTLELVQRAAENRKLDL